MRNVYPGFIQLTNFISMNRDKHNEAQHELVDHLVKGDDDAAEKKLSFYEEYLAVADLPAEFYLSTIRIVFQEHLLPKGELVVRWHKVKRSEEHTSELQSLMRISYAVFCLKKKTDTQPANYTTKSIMKAT